LQTALDHHIQAGRAGYPNECKYLGDRIKCRRLDLGLLQREAD